MITVEIKKQGSGYSVYYGETCLGYGFDVKQVQMFYIGFCLGLEKGGVKYIKKNLLTDDGKIIPQK